MNQPRIIKNAGGNKITLSQQDLNDWYKALASGDYKKGTLQLYDHKTNSYCCIGVLAIVLGFNFDDGGFNIVNTNNIIREPLEDQSYMLGSIGLPQELTDELMKLNDRIYRNSRTFTSKMISKIMTEVSKYKLQKQ